jgi:hypothetical protein
VGFATEVDFRARWNRGPPNKSSNVLIAFVSDGLRDAAALSRSGKILLVTKCQEIPDMPESHIECPTEHFSRQYSARAWLPGYQRWLQEFIGAKKHLVVGVLSNIAPPQDSNR